MMHYMMMYVVICIILLMGSIALQLFFIGLRVEEKLLKTVDRITLVFFVLGASGWFVMASTLVCKELMRSV
jgi:hypothetical protein